MSSKVIGIPAYDTQYIYIYIYTVTFKDGLIAEYIENTKALHITVLDQGGCKCNDISGPYVKAT